MPVGNALLFLGSFALIWIGAGLIITSINRIAKGLRLSSFALSIFLLGILTSIPELGVGLTAVAEKKYDVYVGNLLGGIPLIFLLVLPIFAILCGKISLNHSINRRHLLFSLIAVSIPSLLCLDGVISRLDGFLMLITYALHVLYIATSKGALNVSAKQAKNSKPVTAMDLAKMFLGVAGVFVASHVIVDQTLLFASLYSISPFFISLIFVSIGTNIPELALAVRSSFSGNKSVAFGDYIGSAAANVLFLGVFSLVSIGKVTVANNPLSIFLFTVGGLAVFYIFIRSKNELSRKEGAMLLFAYISFILIEYYL